MRKNRYLKYFKSDFILLAASIIWGFAFVAQRKAMDDIGPFLYNGIRFFLGASTLFPYFFLSKKNKEFYGNRKSIIDFKLILLGIILFIAASFQQIGIIYTEAGKAGFITGLYVVIVPIFGIFVKRKTSIFKFFAAFLSAIGLYLLSVKKNFTIERGDLLVLIGAFFWAIHVLYIDYLVKNEDPLRISIYQFYICSFISLIFAFVFEKVLLNKIIEAIIPILYGGVLSVGVAYTFQVIGQKEAHPSHASIILSMESVFAVIGGVILLNEQLNSREIVGIILMFSGMIISQIFKN